LLINQQLGERRGEGASCGNLGRVYLYLGDARKAMTLFEQHLKIACDLGYRRDEGICPFNCALAFEKLNERGKAIATGEAARKIFEEIGYPAANRLRPVLAKWKENKPDDRRIA
jgi:tetratricopeptide (TPR) repeat protein